MTFDPEDGSSIDLHGKLAVIELVLGLLVSVEYSVLSRFNLMSGFLWGPVLIIPGAIVLLVHYVANRKSRAL